MNPKYMDGDVLIIGGGIVGLATGLALAERHGRRVMVLEAEAGISRHQTGHNSGVLHSGLYYAPGSAKATTCRTGLELMYRFCEEEGIPFRRCGKVVVAVSEEEIPRLDALAERGTANGVMLRRIAAPELRELEPEVSGVAGLHVLDTGVVSFKVVAAAMARRLERSGGQVRPNHRVTGIRREAGRITLETTGGSISGEGLVNCSGLQADRVARLAGWDPELRIVPFRGEYYTLRPERAHLVRGLIYPVPDPSLPFLGVHFTRGIDGTVEAGPNAVLALSREGYGWGDLSLRDILDWAAFPGFWRMAWHHRRKGGAELGRSLSKGLFLRSLRRLLPGLEAADLVAGGSGVRAQAVSRRGDLVTDFVIIRRGEEVHVLNAPSPAATASLAIGRHVAELLMLR